MSLPTPNLDDRTFEQLMEEALGYIDEHCPEWKATSAGDPGRVLLEAFAYITEGMLYRFNRLPEKAFVEFLKLIGTRQNPPSAARVKLVFTRHNQTESRIEIPKSTRITVVSEDVEEAPVFMTEQTLILGAGEREVQGYATHGTWVEGELAGISNGMPGFSVKAAQAPIPSVTTSQQDIRIGVEVEEGELGVNSKAISFQGKLYQLWEVVEHFKLAHNTEQRVCTLDRVSGQITFSPSVQLEGEDGLLTEEPSLIAATPKIGREIRLWYFTGGGKEGNVAANLLTVLKDPIPGISVSNPEGAIGGREKESLDNALKRGPMELYSLNRAITAQDFEQIVLNSSGQIKRAKAFASKELWSHGVPGSVEVTLVPNIEFQSPTELTYENLAKHSVEDALLPVQSLLDKRSPIGITSKVAWAKYKPVSVEAKLITHGLENIEAAEARINQRLCELISPLPSKRNKGLSFGETLHISSVYDVLLSDSGVKYVDELKLKCLHAPSPSSTTIAADFFQAGAWYTNSKGKLFRSLDNGKGWELIAHFEGDEISGIYPNPDKSGCLAIISEYSETVGSKTQSVSRIRFSGDCGETWDKSRTRNRIAKIRDASWLIRENSSVLMLATDKGLYELEYKPRATPTQLKVGNLQSDLGFYAVSASRYVGGVTFVAVSAQNERGVYLSRDAGITETYEPIGLDGKDIRHLTIQQEGRSLLWAGITFSGNENEAEGCCRLELTLEKDSTHKWEYFATNWGGGSCNGLSFAGKRLYAATHSGGLLVLDISNPDFEWKKSVPNDGLRLRNDKEPAQFEELHAVAASSEGLANKVMVATSQGVFSSDNYGSKFSLASEQVYANKVSLPATWLLCSESHKLDIVPDYET